MINYYLIIEFILLSIISISAFFISKKISSHYIEAKLFKKSLGKLINNNQIKFFQKEIYLLIFSLFNILLVIIIKLIFLNFDFEIIITDIFLNISIVILITSLISIIIGNNIFSKILNLLILLFFLLDNSFDFLPYLKNDAFSLSIGNINFTFYFLIKAIISTILIIRISFFVREKLKKYIVKKNMDSSNKNILNKFIDISIITIAIIIIFEIFGISLRSFAFVGGAIGVGIGFGLQKITSNFISGLLLLFEKSVAIGDIVELDNNITGYLTDFKARYSIIKTFDGKEVIIPNEEFIIKRVVNLSYTDNNARIDIDVGISYDSDIEKAIELLENIALKHPLSIKKDPDYMPRAYVTNFADNAINIKLFFWIEDVLNGKMEPKSDVMREILLAFKKYNIEIPFPQRDINIKNYNNKII